MSEPEQRQRAERQLAALYESIEEPGDAASPDAILGAHAAAANLSAAILVSDAVDQGARALRQFTESVLYDVIPRLRGALGAR